MGWNDMPEFGSSSSSADDNRFAGPRLSTHWHYTSECMD